MFEMRFFMPILALIFLPCAALAGQSEQDKLFAELAKADSPETAHPIEEKLGALFKLSGSPTVDLLMTRASQSLQGADNKTATTLIETVTEIAPHYAEGWRSRAQLQAADGDDAGAMLSLQKAVELNPRHFAAMAELGSMLEDYGDKAGALKLYRRALALDPQLGDAARREKALSKAVEGQGI